VIDLVVAEWLKLRTTRLVVAVVPAAVALSFAAVAGAVLSMDSSGQLGSADGVRRVLAVTGTGAIVVLVAGILVSAGEYRHGTACDTFLSTPRRHRVLMAKLWAGAALGSATGAITSLVCVGVAAVLYDARDATFPFGDADVWLTLAGTLTYTTLFAVLGVALGSLLRNQVLAISCALAWLAVVEHTLVNLAPDIGRWLPAATGQAIVRTPLDQLLSPLAGAGVLTFYAAAIAVAGVRVAATRDA
jgi:ABC-2 type transport system permease protein